MLTQKYLTTAETLKVGDVAFLTYLLNPFTIAVCVGSSTSPVENLMTILALYGATAGTDIVSVDIDSFVIDTLLK